jgi:hypothetical protein
VAVVAQQDLFYIAPADDKPIRFHAIFLAQGTEIGDAMEEMLRIAIIRGHATVGSGGTAPTPAPLALSTELAAGFVARVNDTTIASAGTAQTLHEDYWNIRMPYLYIPTPEIRPGCSQGNTTIVVRLLTTPADSITMSGTLYVEEFP